MSQVVDRFLHLYTEGYEGFFHLNNMSGDVEHAYMNYIIRDHDHAKFEEKKALMTSVVSYLNTKYGEGTVELNLKDSYYNMREKIEPHKYLIEIAENAMKSLDVEPVVCPIRGGTDGAQLSFMGLPCPNLGTGGHAYHGPYEHITVEGMDIAVDVGLKIIELFYK